MTADEWAHELALVIAKARFGPGVDMGGRHNPKPSEQRAARDFVDAILAQVPAQELDVEQMARALYATRLLEWERPDGSFVPWDAMSAKVREFATNEGRRIAAEYRALGVEPKDSA